MFLFLREGGWNKNEEEGREEEKEEGEMHYENECWDGSQKHRHHHHEGIP